MLSRIILLLVFSGVFAQEDDCPMGSYNDCPSQVSYWLYTRDSKHGVRFDIHTDRFKKLFTKSKMMKILIHGNGGNHTDAFNTKIRHALMKRDDDFNIISVDWSPISRQDCAAQSALNTRAVGYCMAKFVKMNSKKMIHIIGFGMGAHVPAFIWPHVSSLHYVTGLDPTKDEFHTEDFSQRISAHIAEYVDVYHTATNTRGQSIQSGHVDVYFNDGGNQPGCTDEVCSHNRAYEYYAESIKTGFYGRKCSFNRCRPLFECNELSSVRLGYTDTPPHGSRDRDFSQVYKVETNAEAPFFTNSI